MTSETVSSGTVVQREAAESTPMLEVRDVRKRYHGRNVVDGVSMYVKRGEIVGLLGPNGAGKTTTFYMIVGLVHPDSGTVNYDGRNVTGMPVYKRARMGMGYLAQEPSVFRKMTVRENVMAILEMLELTREESNSRADALLEDLGLRRVEDQKAYTLSGGERRKLEISRALVTSPSILMLDEPFSGVDPLAVQDIQRIITCLRDRGLGIVVTDHNVRETLAVVDRAYLLHDGKILREGVSSFLVQDEMSRRLYLGKEFRM